jgi:hydrogenase maturation factor HypE
MANSKARGVSFEDPAIIGGTVDNSPVGATTPSTGAFTTLSASGNVTLGDAVTDTIGFYGVTAIAQRAASTQGALTLTTSTSSGFSFTTSAAFSAGWAQVEEIRATLVALGLMKGAA